MKNFVQPFLFITLLLASVEPAFSQDIYKNLFAQRRQLLDSITVTLNYEGRIAFASGIVQAEVTDTKWSLEFAGNIAAEDSCICLCKWMYSLADNDTYIFYFEELLPKQITVSGETIIIPYVNDDDPLFMHVANEAKRNKVIKWLQELYMLCGG